MYLYSIDLSPAGLFKANETNNWNNLKTGKRETR